MAIKGGATKTSPASILYKSIAGRYRPVSYPDGPITARYRSIKNAYWVVADIIESSSNLGILSLYTIDENRIPLETDRGMLHIFIIPHNETHSNRVCYFWI